MSLAEKTKNLRELEARHAIQTDVHDLVGKSWTRRAEETLQNLAGRFGHELLGVSAASLSVGQINDNCPGLACAVRTMFEAWRAALQQNPRAPKPSDFPDMLHALYAPYVNVFRADAFMAPLVARFAPGTVHVVPKLDGLLPAINRALAAASEA